MFDLFEREKQLEQARQLAFNRISGLMDYVITLTRAGFASDPRMDDLMDEINCIYADYDMQSLLYSRDLFDRCNIDVLEDGDHAE